MKNNSSDYYELSEKEMAMIEGGRSFWRWLWDNGSTVAAGIVIGFMAGSALR